MSNFDRDQEYGHDRALAVLADFASDAPDDQKITVMNAALHIDRACPPRRFDTARNATRRGKWRRS